MCGIAGIFKKSGNISNEDVLRMVTSLYNRGPDDAGYFLENIQFKAGMRRLSIVDIDHGIQPFKNLINNDIVFYNGEIYNYRDLRRELEVDGIHFKTNCDGEVITHLYTKYGIDLFQKLDGMFAVAIWDSKKEVLILARDFPGEKPLYYSELDNGIGLAFSSDISSLISCKEVSRTLDYQAIWDFPTYLWVPEPSTIYKNVKALMPGGIITVGKNGILHSSFKDKIVRPSYEFKNEVEALQSVRSVVIQAVTSRMMGDVPMGAFLSGGLDSSIICAVASKINPELQTFCASFEDIDDPYHGSADESKEAARFASELNLKHTNIQTTATSFKNLLPAFIKASGQPYAVSSGLGILAISKVAKERGVKVLLSGDGADEAFGGYSWYSSLANISQNIDAGKEKTLNQYDRFIDIPGNLIERERIIQKYPPEVRAWALHYYASEFEKIQLFNPNLSLENSLRYFSLDRFSNPIDYINSDRNYYFPNEMLTKVDRMTMANSVEGRAPFASPSVQFFAENLPFNMLVKGSTLKWCLRQAFSDILPGHIIERKKHGFNVPIDYWLKGEWRDIFRHSFSNDSALFKHGIIRKDAGIYAEQLLNNNNVNGHVLFSFIILNMWMESIYEG